MSESGRVNGLQTCGMMSEIPIHHIISLDYNVRPVSMFECFLLLQQNSTEWVHMGS